MAGTAISRRGFLGHLGGAAATAVIVPATIPIPNEEQRLLTAWRLLSDTKREAMLFLAEDIAQKAGPHQA
ncbi:MAG: twin-arginine translocation signal domain-containing protein [Hyphomicrobiales bacterium]|nr:MAG: twin-arginine translocation signal domain-containing protein [Hyphomicrobiales bacterium]